MVTSEQTFKAFVKLGTFLRNYVEWTGDANKDSKENPWFAKMDVVVRQAGHENGWFTHDQVLFALANWGELLTEEKINNWLKPYDQKKSPPQIVALIMAGNIPLVGFHDLLCVLLTGHKALIKQSGQDTKLLPFLVEYLKEAMPELARRISFQEGLIGDYDWVIATGSNNSARYFDYYFGSKPHIIRKNRNSVAILKGTETKEELKALGHDIFSYYGLGCRNVTKLFVPEGYNLATIYEAWDSFSPIKEEQKYLNNYEYNKAIYLMSEFPFLDNGFIVLKEDSAYASPIGTLFFEYYKELESVKNRIAQDRHLIQCVVSKGLIPGEVSFGETQKPSLNDYADNLDTVEFLLKT